MLSLLHGDNLVKSRLRLQAYMFRARQKAIKDVIQIDGKKLDLNQITQLVETQSFFATPKLVIIENLHKHPSKKTLKSLIEYLRDNPLPQATHVVLWESKTLTATQIRKLPPGTNIESFKSSPVVFTFLDSLSPQSPKSFVSLYQQACQQDSAEFVFFMLIRHLRQLFLSQNPQSKLPPWQKSKLLRQSKKWAPQQLTVLHDKLTDLDWRQKNSRLVGDFKSELENILLTL